MIYFFSFFYYFENFIFYLNIFYIFEFYIKKEIEIISSIIFLTTNILDRFLNNNLKKNIFLILLSLSKRNFIIKSS